MNEQEAKLPEVITVQEQASFLAELKAFVANRPIQLVAKAIFDMTRQDHELDRELFRLTSEEMAKFYEGVIQKYVDSRAQENTKAAVRAGKGGDA